MKFVKSVLDEESKTFVVHIATLKDPLLEIIIYFLRKACITTLKQNGAPTKISTKYFDFANVFIEEKILILPEQTDFNKYAIKLKRDKQQFYGFIYSLGLVKVKTLKNYIKTHLKIGFISLSKSPASASILFDKKLDINLYL